MIPQSNDVEKDLYIADLEAQVVRLLGQRSEELDQPQVGTEDRESGTVTVQFKHGLESLSDAQIFEECKRDPKVWRLAQVYWKKRSSGFLYTANFTLLDKDAKASYQQKFIDYLSSDRFKVRLTPARLAARNPALTNGLLVLNKQDFHFNKHDVFGNNDVQQRFADFESATVRLAAKAARNYNLEKIVYVIGSDSFNAEWSGTTTKGTPQQNTHGYHNGFELIVAHEIKVINFLLTRGASVEVLYVPGNHDEYVGWHLVKMLEMAFRKEPRLQFQTLPRYRKYVRYGKSALMFNHGAEVKPEQLAHIFPDEFRDEWSFTEFAYIFTGDKHRRIEKEFGVIEWYSLPALSSAKSNWDDLKAHNGKAVYQAFLIEEENGMADIYKEYMK